MKIGGANPYERCMSARQDYLVHLSRWVFLLYLLLLLFNDFLFHSQSLACARYIALKQQYVPHTNTSIPAMIPTYGRALSTIEKALQELVKEYWGVGKSLRDLVEGQERNIAQLERIGAIMEQRWSSEEKNGKEESRNNVERSEDGPREIQKEGTLSSTSY